MKPTSQEPLKVNPWTAGSERIAEAARKEALAVLLRYPEEIPRELAHSLANSDVKKAVRAYVEYRKKGKENDYFSDDNTGLIVYVTEGGKRSIEEQGKYSKNSDYTTHINDDRITYQRRPLPEDSLFSWREAQWKIRLPEGSFRIPFRSEGGGFYGELERSLVPADHAEIVQRVYCHEEDNRHRM